MTVNRVYFFIFSLFIIANVFLACSSISKKAPNYAKSTPGAIPINDTLFCDQTEATNFHWLEYLYWVGRAYGAESPEYKAALPQDSLWKDKLCMNSLDDNYMRHVAYRDYPMLGITQIQAEKYSEWRSDRVFEYYLIKNKMLEFLSHTIDSSYFSIQGYFDGSFTPSYVKTDPKKVFIRDTSLLFPTYRLPTSADRKIILDYVDSTDYYFVKNYSKREQKWMEENAIPLYLQIEPCDSNMLLIEPITSVSHGYPDLRKLKFLLNIRGNVAEWSSEPNVTFGGGWPHNRSYIFKHDTISSYTPNAWTGFRNVCSWGKFDFGK